jgi:hypothetical protein
MFHGDGMRMCEINHDMKLPEPWQQQPYESGEAYRRFLEHYLAIPAADRSVVRAYNRYLSDRGMQGNKSNVPGSWRKLAYASDARGRRIRERLTWAERAAAWDRHLQNMKTEALAAQASAEAEVWAARRLALLETEWAIGSALMQRAEARLNTPLFRRVSRQSPDGKTQTTVVEPAGWR